MQQHIHIKIYGKNLMNSILTVYMWDVMFIQFYILTVTFCGNRKLQQMEKGLTVFLNTLKIMHSEH